MKTNKSYTKRLKKTRTGKLLSRKLGQNHFNAKESNSTALAKKGQKEVSIKNKTLSRAMPYNNK